ncbi:hypothetical protein SAMN02745130_00160 [Thiothrix eikelboomii]|uniref:Uncharacterized protein n=1 Tax=Thiothrix eikelboomii TaxID=92487 RepID=A0A1T4VSK9_9GAMM|nr:hypothetical protein [Thiothrix eikelboomii]SKA67927.1 hypothetical protein SAMN02745130_00160 [Thiothrix eikelboomii]
MIFATTTLKNTGVIRSYVQWRKTSFASQSAQGDRFKANGSTVLGTARDCKLNSVTAI